MYLLHTKTLDGDAVQDFHDLENAVQTYDKLVRSRKLISARIVNEENGYIARRYQKHRAGPGKK